MVTPETKKITSTLHIGSYDAPRCEVIIDLTENRTQMVSTSERRLQKCKLH